VRGHFLVSGLGQILPALLYSLHFLLLYVLSCTLLNSTFCPVTLLNSQFCPVTLLNSNFCPVTSLNSTFCYFTEFYVLPCYFTDSAFCPVTLLNSTFCLWTTTIGYSVSIVSVYGAICFLKSLKNKIWYLAVLFSVVTVSEQVDRSTLTVYSPGPGLFYVKIKIEQKLIWQRKILFRTQTI
jgi:hypothetical protein